MAKHELPKTKRYQFFSHSACEFFPCHQTDDPARFNCLFCYCPLYALGEDCGGNFTYTGSGIKDCSNCTLPHNPESYDYIIGRFADVAALGRKAD